MILEAAVGRVRACEDAAQAGCDRVRSAPIRPVNRNQANKACIHAASSKIGSRQLPFPA